MVKELCQQNRNFTRKEKLVSQFIHVMEMLCTPYTTITNLTCNNISIPTSQTKICLRQNNKMTEVIYENNHCYSENNMKVSKYSNVGVTLVGTYSNHCCLDGYNICAFNFLRINYNGE